VTFADHVNQLILLPEGERRKLVLVIGAGISQLSTIRHPRVILSGKASPHLKKCLKCRHSDETYERNRAVWSEFEYSRLFSRNVLPPQSYYFMAQLCGAGLVRSILTTNYDSFLWSIFTRDRSLPDIIINPLLSRHSTDASGYRNHSDPEKLEIYFLHGSFEWAQFKDCGCLVALPAWAVGTNLWRVEERWGGVFFHDYREGHSLRPTGAAQHFIDWNLGNRDPFTPEIDAARGEIEWAKNNGGVLLLLGFMGTHCPRLPSWHEEISAPIVAAAQRTPTFMVITDEQDGESRLRKRNRPWIRERRWLLNKIAKAPQGQVHIYPDITDWFIEHLAGTRLDPEEIDQDFNERWVFQQLFLEVEAFKGTR